MTIETHSPLTLHQCLCGYSDGHKLLASSRKIPNSVMPLLLSYSDMAPGLALGKFEGYWTGIPLLPIKSYALMHTWPASELPRPGCVWTHILLIEFADLPKISALNALRRFFARPYPQNEYARYEIPYVVNIQDMYDSSVMMDVDESEVLPILESLYSSEATGYVYHSKHIQDVVFAVWSQQWAKLKRSFSFRTASGGAVTTGSALHQKFDLCVLSGMRNNTRRETIALEPWKRVAVDDILGISSDFRQFLWRYGADMQRGKERFSFLANLYLETRTNYLSGKALERVLDNIVSKLPHLNDGKLLKEDLLSGENNTFSLMPPTDQIDVLCYFVNGFDKNALPKHFNISKEAISNNKDWVSRFHQLLPIAEQALSNKNPFSTDIVEVLSLIASQDTFLKVSRNYPLAREQVVRRRPYLLNSEHITDIHQPELNALIESIDSDELLTIILEHLTKLDDNIAAERVAAMSPSVLCDYAFRYIVSNVLGEKFYLSKCWINAAKKNSANKMIAGWLEQAVTSAELYAIISFLDTNIARGLMFDTDLWCRTAMRMRNNISDKALQRVQTYFLALALARPQKGCEVLFELAFEPIHQALQKYRLQHELFELLDKYLPSLFLWRQWDKCLRLRLAIVQAYTENALSPESFLRLAQNTSLQQQLVELSKNTDD